jgi:hypothetical protein
MFEDLFIHPKHITRHREGACAAECERFLRLRHCAERRSKDIDAFRASWRDQPDLLEFLRGL